MKVFVFCGPTISEREARGHLDAHYLPPAAQGDVLAAAQEAPVAIGIIDGYFQAVPSVRHKEVLWALSRGIHVFGSSSMGALRAAELDSFGMVGVGEIYRAYRRGTFVRDDEVALTHGPAELGYPAVSEPLVNIRATLAEAVTVRVIDEQVADALLAATAKLFFPERSYARMLDEGARLGLPAAELERLASWLEAGKVDLKKRDAIEMLQKMRSFLDGPVAPFAPLFDLERTAIFDGLAQW